MGNAIGVGIGVAWRWVALYAPLTFVTQLWAGSQFSPGQGGGLAELAWWAGVFGLVTVVVCVERAINGSRVIDPGAVFVATVIGQAIGTAIAVWWFTTKGGPGPRDWWVAPAVACAMVTVWVHLLAPKRTREE